MHASLSQSTVRTCEAIASRAGMSFSRINQQNSRINKSLVGRDHDAFVPSWDRPWK
jgi:hypothetical protein